MTILDDDLGDDFFSTSEIALPDASVYYSTTKAVERDSCTPPFMKSETNR